MSSSGEIDVDLVSRRSEYLACLGPGQTPKAALVERLGVSRSTVNRAVAELAEAGLVVDRPGGCRLTAAGRLARDAYEEFHSSIHGIEEAKDLLTGLGPEAEVGPEIVAGADVQPAKGPQSFRAFHAFERLIEEADRIRGTARTYANPRAIELFEDAIIKRGVETEFFFDERLLEEAPAELLTTLQRWQATGPLSMFVAPECPRHTVLVSEGSSGPEMGIAFYSAALEFQGVIVNDAPEAVRWAHDRLDAIADRSTSPAATLADGGPSE